MLPQTAPLISVLARVYGFDGITVRDTPEHDGLIYTAQRGERQASAIVMKRSDDTYYDAFDELDAKLAAGGEPLPTGPLTFDITAPA